MTTLDWHQTKLAWIASLPEVATKRGGPISLQISPPIRDLCSRLLTIAGKEVCVPFTERDGTKLLQRGKTYLTHGLELRLGDPNECHANCSRIWELERRSFAICTGYALTAEDSMWRQHTWLVDRAKHIVETAQVRELYFGFKLNYLESLLFTSAN